MNIHMCGPKECEDFGNMYLRWVRVTSKDVYASLHASGFDVVPVCKAEYTMADPAKVKR